MTYKNSLSPYIIPGLKNKDEILMRRISDKDLIITSVCEYFKVQFEEISRKTRTENVLYRRKIAQYLLCHCTNLSLNNIGSIFGNQDHTTVIHNRRYVEEQLTTRWHNTYKDDVNNIVQLIMEKI